jgi:hypothetical protein
MENFGIGDQKKAEEGSSIDSDSGAMRKVSISSFIHISSDQSDGESEQRKIRKAAKLGQEVKL